MAMFEQLKDACPDVWAAYTQHDFLYQLARGELDKASFQHYLKQDYLFLRQFTRAWGLAVYKSDTFEQMRYAQQGINAMLDTEIALHIKYCAEQGVSEAELENLPESAATVAYTRFVLDRGMAGDLAELHVALSPCVIGYAEIANHLMEQDFTVLEGNPYRDWIEMYASQEYQQVADAQRDTLDQLIGEVSAERLTKLQQTFTTATRMEVAFWQMGLDLAE